MPHEIMTKGNYQPLHDVTNWDKVREIAAQLTAGQTVPPVVLIEELGSHVAVTGTHRQAAAQKSGVSIPAIVLTMEEACEAMQIQDLSEYDHADHDTRYEQIEQWAKQHGHDDLAAAMSDQYAQ